MAPMRAQRITGRALPVPGSPEQAAQLPLAAFGDPFDVRQQHVPHTLRMLCCVGRGIVVLRQRELRGTILGIQHPGEGVIILWLVRLAAEGTEVGVDQPRCRLDVEDFALSWYGLPSYSPRQKIGPPIVQSVSRSAPKMNSFTAAGSVTTSQTCCGEASMEMVELDTNSSLIL